jgi:hypothetical protein
MMDEMHGAFQPILLEGLYMDRNADVAQNCILLYRGFAIRRRLKCLWSQ